MKKDFQDGTIETDKPIAILSYIGILFLIPLLTKRESRFVQLHAKQGLILFGLWVLGVVMMPIVSFSLGGLILLVVVIFSIWGIWNVSQGTERGLPLIGYLAEKMKFGRRD